MPHMVISYSKALAEKIDIQQLTQAIWDSADKTGLFTPQAIKVRAFPVEHYVTANTDQPFVHVDAKLFEGRTVEQKQGMLSGYFDVIANLVADDVSISVEAIELAKSNYLKR
ncbi:5-carboxymethyl-2-hydroxymuconate Delta-isomerase [Cohaesibacter celericrescens]|uniref:5-carboxymethyl-2-hydroxymuconate Delta-isomerase n=1 Tax=Cohaesibacter celericrescens TaxID=2067669 RepID=UPI00356620C5